MEISPWIIYWIMQADSILSMIETVALIFTIIAILALIFMTCPNSEIRRAARRVMVPCVFILSISGIGATFIPSSKTLATIIAVPTVIQIADDIQLDETAKKSVETINKTIDSVNKLLDSYLLEE